jgi:hypothetical protein
MRASLLIVASWMGLGAAFAPSKEEAPVEGDYRLDRFLFFAVLEGLCEEGLPDELVTEILEKDRAGDKYVHFVYACPICTPTVEAFRAFALRDKFQYSRKGEAFFSECTVPEEILKDLQDGSDERLRKGLHALIERYVQRRMDVLRLTPEERSEWNGRLMAGRKKGMGYLQSFKLDMKECPSCEGAVGGSRNR